MSTSLTTVFWKALAYGCAVLIRELLDEEKHEKEAQRLATKPIRTLPDPQYYLGREPR